MRILELFSGYGSQALALENLGIEFTSDISEIDKYAIQAYNQLHGETHNWGDITKIDETKLPYYDLITYSSPCQDFSVAGLQKGGDKDSGTRSSLLWECERIIRAVKPKYLLMENVKNLVGKKHKHNFVRWLNTLEMMGYQNFWKVLNAKDYGVPQNRERVFVVSILGCGQYLFPNPVKLEKRLKDILEPVVDEKYYLSDKIVEGFVKRTKEQLEKKGGFIFRPSDGNTIGSTITTNPGQRTVDNYIIENICIGGMQKHQSITKDGISTCLTSSMGQGGGYVPMVTEPICCASRGRNPENPSDRTVGAPTEQRLEVNQTGCSNTLTSVQKDNYVLEPNVLTPKRTEYGKQIRKDYESGTVKESRHNMTELEPRNDGIANTLTTVEKDNFLIEPKIIQSSHGFNKGNVYKNASTVTSSGYENNNFVNHNYRIRKLTPLECWRLMGVRDEDFNKLHGISNTQLYKMAGNSIVVDVLMGIFKNLFLTNNSTGQLTLF